MVLKIIILVLLAGIIISLFSGFVFLAKEDQSKRTFHSLGVRVAMAVSLLLVIAYGLSTGQLGSNAPWDPSMQGASTTANSAAAQEQGQQLEKASPQTSQDVDEDKQ